MKEKRSELFQKHHITRIGIFGSVIRDEAGLGSDIDILVDFSDDASLLDPSGLKIYLEKILGEPVDVIPERAAGQNSYSLICCVHMRTPDLYLQDILDACTRIDRFIGSLSLDDFSDDDKTLSVFEIRS